MSRGVLKGDRLAVSKAISAVENRGEDYPLLLREIFPHTGHAFVIGVTGPPGTGKSSLVDRLLKVFRARGDKVAVLAVDPTSPVTGGAILGDRVRMISHTLDEGVYIRSMASRGDEGGLSRAAMNAV
ncbi:MAG: methylmalonyl Co-A mutase-associated GTPase MeaB, partial [Nitrososphaerales archaeon]